jgi:hypothetical protein
MSLELNLSPSAVPSGKSPHAMASLAELPPARAHLELAKATAPSIIFSSGFEPQFTPEQKARIKELYDQIGKAEVDLSDSTDPRIRELRSIAEAACHNKDILWSERPPNAIGDQAAEAPYRSHETYTFDHANFLEGKTAEERLKSLKRMQTVDYFQNGIQNSLERTLKKLEEELQKDPLNTDLKSDRQKLKKLQGERPDPFATHAYALNPLPKNLNASKLKAEIEARQKAILEMLLKQESWRQKIGRHGFMNYMKGELSTDNAPQEMRDYALSAILRGIDNPETYADACAIFGTSMERIDTLDQIALRAAESFETQDHLPQTYLMEKLWKELKTDAGRNFFGGLNGIYAHVKTKVKPVPLSAIQTAQSGKNALELWAKTQE